MIVILKDIILELVQKVIKMKNNVYLINYNVKTSIIKPKQLNKIFVLHLVKEVKLEMEYVNSVVL